METTERKYWQNGIHKRGKDFYTFAISFGGYGFLCCVVGLGRWVDFGIYRLN